MKKFTKLLVCSFLTLCFGMSVSAQTSADSATVTFQVDMNSVATAFTTPEVNGSFNNWCGNCWAMSDSDGDNVWDVSGKVLKNTAHEFKFSADGWGIQENLFSGSSCTVTNFGYTNRALNVSGDTTLGVVCWESCDPCGGAPSAYNVTFQVDMNGVSGFTTPEVNGTFNGWCGNCWAMSDADGDNVWDFTTLLAPGSYQYKFSADLWSIQESLDSNLSCVTTTIDTSLPSGYAVNRSFDVVASDLILDVVPWNGCASAVLPGCTDATANNYDASANSDDGSCMYDITLTVDLNCESFTPGYVAATGPSDGWSCGTYALTDVDANGVWEGTFSLPGGTFEYIYCADGWAQNETAGLIAAMNAGSTCAPVTDYATYANRLITIGALTTVDTWGSCGTCAVSISGCTDPLATNYDPTATVDDGSCLYSSVLTITTTVCSSATSVALTGPWWGWDPTAGPTAVDNGNGTWTFTLDPAPTADMEYLLVVDGVQEDLVAAGTASGDWSCTPITDYFSYANRQWVVGSGNVTNTYNTCGTCAVSISGCTDPLATNYDPTATVDDGSCLYSSVLTITTTVCSSATSVALTGPWWGWDPTAGPTAVDNGNGTWTFTLDPAPTADMEYLLVVDGVQEDLVAAGTASGDWSCTPITDYFSYANRQWVVGSGNVTNTYNTCGTCAVSISGCTDPLATNYDPTATVDDGSCLYGPILTQIDLPLTWDDNTVDYTVTPFGGTTASLVADPTNASNTVLEVDRTAGSPTWAGTTLGTNSGFATDIPLTLSNSTMSVSVWSPQAGTPIRLKVEDSNDPTHTCETEVNTTASGWQVLVFDFTNEAPGTQSLSVGLGFGWTFDKASVFCDFGNVPSTSTLYYLDDVTFGGIVSSVSGCTDPIATNYNPVATTDDGSCLYSGYAVTLSVNTANITVGVNGMYAGGGVLGDALAVPLSDPDGDGTWTGVTIINAGTTGNYIFLNSPANGGDWGTKEDLSGQSCADPNNWNDRILPNIISDTTLLHCFGNCDTDGSCSISGCTDPLATNYDPTATVDDGSCLYGPILTQIDLPLTWDDNTVDYTVTPFGGTTASLVADPTNASNTVLEVDRTAGSPTWAGTTLGTNSGFATDIPLTLSNSTMSVSVWSPQAGTPIRLKVEDSNDPTHTCETEVNTTASGWQVLVFDFTNEAPGTQSLSVGLGFGWTFDKASVFCDFGNVPSTSTLYYLDDVTFGGVVSSVSGCTDPLATNYDPTATVDDGSCLYSSVLTITTTVCSSATSVALTGPWWGWDPTAGPTAVDNGNGTWTFTLDPAPTADMEYLLVVDGVQEDLVAAGTASGDWSCTPITDYFSYANRQWVVGSGNVTNTYNTCGTCAVSISGCTDPSATNYDPTATVDDGSCLYSSVLTITTTVCSSATSVALTGPWWGWDPTAGPTAVDNGNGTWTFTLDPAPTADMEYLLVVDGVQEDLVAAGTASGDWSCTPITDYFSYANRQWVVGSGNVTNTYNTCGTCAVSISGCTDPTALNYDSLANNDDGSCIYCVYGCTDPVATNYYAGATCDDNSCSYAPSTCTSPSPTNVYISELIHDRARIIWDNMNSSSCIVDQYRINYREQGTTTWSSKTMGAPVGSCNFGTQKVDKLILNLNPSTTYEYYMKAWYCGGGVSTWSALQNFTTADECENIINFAVSTPTTIKASFTWDTTGAYSFARIKLRVDTTGGIWTSAGGFGVFYPALSKN